MKFHKNQQVVIDSPKCPQYHGQLATVISSFNLAENKIGYIVSLNGRKETVRVTSLAIKAY